MCIRFKNLFRDWFFIMDNMKFVDVEDDDRI